MKVNMEQGFKIPEWAILTIIIILIISAIIPLSRWVVNRQETVMSSNEVGGAVTAQFIDSINVDKTRVETDRGVYLVYGTFQITKGDLLELQKRKNNDRFLCVIDTHDCKKLVD